ncbi:MAG: radical SAM protein [Candidatus Woesearchaeota archaeon]
MSEEQLRLKAPLIVQMEITPECNNRCGFCYNFWEYDLESSLSRISSTDEAKVRGLFEVLVKKEVPAVCFTGGEPFLAENLLFDLLKRANQEGMYTSINSHGRQITRNSAHRLNEQGLNSILISLHGDTEEVHGEAVGCPEAFTQTLVGLDNLLDEGINLTVNYVSTQKNVGRIVSTAKLLNDKGVCNMTITPLLPFPGVQDHELWAMKREQFRQYFDALISARETGLRIDSTLPVAPCILKDMFPENYLDYLEVLSPRVCMAGVTFMVVSPDGINRACIQAPQLEEYGSDINGNFLESWKRANAWSRMGLLTSECSDLCYALPSCGGGCRTSSLACNHSTSGKTMYMGGPLSEADSQSFIDRMEVNLGDIGRRFRKRTNVRFREEDFGGVISLCSRQDFVFLDREGLTNFHSLPSEFEMDLPSRGIKVLYAAGIIQNVEHSSELPHYSIKMPVVHTSRLYPRLAGGIPMDDKVRMLRADTGERIYF